MNKRKNIIIVVLLFFIAVLYTILVKFVDVKSIGPNTSSVGFSTVNGFFHDILGLNMTWYKITKYLGLVPFLFVAFYGLNGVIQLLKNKSLKKVDKRLLFLGGFYILVGITYLFFEKVIINYRPVLMDGVLEASYPSSHTMLAICICLSSLLISKYYVKDNYLKIFNIFTILLMIILVVGRFLSGVHWFSDILGGIIISLFLVSLFNLYIFEKKE